MESIPFSIPADRVYKGLVRYEPPALVVEFEKWSWSSFSKETKEVSIPVREIDSVRLKTGWFSTRIQIQLRRIKAASQIPTRHPGTILLKFARADRENVKRLASSLSLAVSEQRLERLGSDTED